MGGITTIMCMIGLLLAAPCATENAFASGPKIIPLWPEGAPGAKGNKKEDIPTLTIALAPKEKANGAAVVICPGGGYWIVAMDHEGIQVGRWLNDHGISAFILNYRHAPRYKHPAPLQDARRAMRIVRSRAGEWGIDPHRIGIMGFSAGGHLASTVGTHYDKGNPKSADPVEQVGCRPDFMILVYPVISMSASYTHTGSRRNLLGDPPDPALLESLSNEKQVTADTPPTFLVHTSSDRSVPSENSIAFYLALHKAGVPAELHIYEKGKHGFGLAPGDPVLSSWTTRCMDWLRGRGLLEKTE